jgi:transcriptional regulator with XRE-family HTH domain
VAKRKNGALRMYRSYLFRDKDPVIDRLRTLRSDTGMKYSEIAAKSGVSVTTLRNWWHGETRRPNFCTVQAAARAMGKTFELVDR